jgi:hypothetical protein
MTISAIASLLKLKDLLSSLPSHWLASALSRAILGVENSQNNHLTQSQATKLELTDH